MLSTDFSYTEHRIGPNLLTIKGIYCKIPKNFGVSVSNAIVLFYYEVMVLKKSVFYTELCYVLGLIFMAFGAAFTELSNFGMSMVVAPTYILHLKVSEYLPWFSFGVAEYVAQAAIIALVVVIIRRFKLSYLFSFITAILYGTLLDGAMYLISGLASNLIAVRVLWFAIGTLGCATAVSLFFHTYISPEAYELIVKELAQKFSFDINKVKTAYDCINTLLAVILSFAFFGFGVLKGVGVGTIICAIVNGFLIGKISTILEKIFRFENKMSWEKFFNNE